jgi:hypothetical protein
MIEVPAYQTHSSCTFGQRRSPSDLAFLGNPFLYTTIKAYTIALVVDKNENCKE